MKKIGSLIRERIVDELKEEMKKAEACFFIGFNKVNAFSFNNLRNDLKELQAQVFVTKNSLFKRVFEELKWEDCGQLLETETGIVFVYDRDIVKVCKTLVDFAKESEILQLKGARLKGENIGLEELNILAKLPPKNVLMQQAVSAIASPLTGFLTCLNQVILKFVWVVEEIKKKKQ